MGDEKPRSSFRHNTPVLESDFGDATVFQKFKLLEQVRRPFPSHSKSHVFTDSWLFAWGQLFERWDGGRRRRLNPLAHCACLNDLFWTHVRTRHFDSCIHCRDDHIPLEVLVHCPGRARDRAPQNHKPRDLKAPRKLTPTATSHTVRYYHLTGEEGDLSTIG